MEYNLLNYLRYELHNHTNFVKLSEKYFKHNFLKIKFNTGGILTKKLNIILFVLPIALFKQNFLIKKLVFLVCL